MTRKEAQQLISEKLNIPPMEAEVILKKAQTGQEFTDDSQLETWLHERFLPNIVLINEDGYAKMCVDALKILKSTAATDYGSSRQRDLGQLWGDMTRGYLAEYAFVLFLKQKWGIDSELGHEKGKIEDFLPTDIHKIKKDGILREPKIKIGIKGTKWNGIWFDIPGAQFHHSDIQVFVKVGTSRDHLFAYFKHISVFKDKVLKKGIEVGVLNQEEADILLESLPVFHPIPAYISGFAVVNKQYEDLPYGGKKGRIHFNIQTWNGEMKSGDLDRIKIKEALPPNGKVKFEGIGEFAHDRGFLFNVGNLLWKNEDWEREVIKRL